MSCIQSRWTPTLVENVGIEPLLLLPRQACNRYTALSIFRADGLNFTHRHFSSLRAVKRKEDFCQKHGMVLRHGIEPWSRAYKARALTIVLTEHGRGWQDRTAVYKGQSLVRCHFAKPLLILYHIFSILSTMQFSSAFHSPRVIKHALGFVYYAFLVNKKIVVFSLFLIHISNFALVLSVFFARIMTSSISFITIVTRRIHIFPFSSFIATPCISNFEFIPSIISMTNGCSYTFLYFQKM